jgi:hypothetical protein
VAQNYSSHSGIFSHGEAGWMPFSAPPRLCARSFSRESAKKPNTMNPSAIPARLRPALPVSASDPKETTPCPPPSSPLKKDRLGCHMATSTGLPIIAPGCRGTRPPGVNVPTAPEPRKGFQSKPHHTPPTPHPTPHAHAPPQPTANPTPRRNPRPASAPLCTICYVTLSGYYWLFALAPG